MFHRVVRGQDPLWSKLYNEFIVPTPNQYIVSQYRPGSGTAVCLRSDGSIGAAPDNDGKTPVDTSKWAKVFTTENFINIDNIKYALETEGAQYVVFDELNSSSVDFYQNFFAELINSPYAYLGPKMVLHIGPGYNIRYEKSSFVGAIDNAFQAGAIISPEVYFRHSDYCEIRFQNLPSSKAEDTWQQNFIKPNFDYLVKRRIAKGSHSIITPVVPTTDQYLDLAIPNDRQKTNLNASAFLQRIFYNIALAKFYSTFSTKVSTGYQCNGIGSYKWSVNAFGFGLEDESMNWDRIIAEVETGAGEGTIQDELNVLVEAANVRTEGFINAWNKYCNLGRNSQITPPSTGNTICKDTEVKQAGYHYSTINQETKSYSIKTTPDPANLINKKSGTKKAFLKKLNFVSKEYDGRKRFNGPSDNSYIIPQKTETFDLWVTETNTGYSTRGVSMASRYYKKYYPQYFQKMPIKVSGICSDEVEYNYLSRFIRQQQVDSVTDHNNLMLLEVPAAGIRCIGLIPEFKGGIETQNSGIPIAPPYEFEFIILRDLNDDYDSQFDTTMEFSKLLNQPEKQRINDEFSLPAMFSVNLKGGDIKPNTGAKKTPTSSNKNGVKNGVNSGTQKANGTGR